MSQTTQLSPNGIIVSEQLPRADGQAALVEDAPRSPANPLVKVLGTLAIVSLSLYLFQQLAPLLRPLLMAVFLCYVILPIHAYLKRSIAPAVSYLLIAVCFLTLLLLLGLVVQASMIDLENDLPNLLRRAREISQSFRDSWTQQFPWLSRLSEDMGRVESYGAKQPGPPGGPGFLNVTAEVVIEAVEAFFYLLFLLLDVHHWPRRIRDSFPGSRSEHILDVSDKINGAMAEYLRLKVRSSLLLALPVTVLLAAFGVKFAILWGVLTFLGNFIPYLGSLVSCTLPVVLAFLQFEPGWQPWLLAAVMATWHMLMHYIIEPMLIGRVVDLSPLVILIALSFWGLCWGVSGMFLAIPLTVMLKIVLDKMEPTRPMARLLAEE